MTLPSAHHGSILTQAPRPVHRTLVRVTERGGSREPSPPAPTSPRPSPPPWGGEGEKAGATCVSPCRPAALMKTSKVGAAYVPSPPFRGERDRERWDFLVAPRPWACTKWRSPNYALHMTRPGLPSGIRVMPDRQLLIVLCGFGRWLGTADCLDLSVGELFYSKRLTS